MTTNGDHQHGQVTSAPARCICCTPPTEWDSLEGLEEHFAEIRSAANAAKHDEVEWAGRYHPLESPHETGACTRCDEIRGTPMGELPTEVAAAAETDIGEPPPVRPELEVISAKLADLENSMHYLTDDVGFVDQPELADFVDLIAMARRRLNAARAET